MCFGMIKNNYHIVNDINWKSIVSKKKKKKRVFTSVRLKFFHLFYTANLLFLFYTIIFPKHLHQFIYFINLFYLNNIIYSFFNYYLLIPIYYYYFNFPLFFSALSPDSLFPSLSPSQLSHLARRRHRSSSSLSPP